MLRHLPYEPQRKASLGGPGESPSILSGTPYIGYLVAFAAGAFGFQHWGWKGAAAGALVGLEASRLVADSTTYTDKNGVEWRVWNSGLGIGGAGEYWSVSTEGYGARFGGALGVGGYVSYDQAIENIEGNASNRDPVTGEIL